MELLPLLRGMYSSAEMGPANALHATGKHLQNASQPQTCQDNGKQRRCPQGGNTRTAEGAETRGGENHTLKRPGKDGAVDGYQGHEETNHGDETLDWTLFHEPINLPVGKRDTYTEDTPICVPGSAAKGGGKRAGFVLCEMRMCAKPDSTSWVSSNLVASLVHALTHAPFDRQAVPPF